MKFHSYTQTSVFLMAAMAAALAPQPCRGQPYTITTFAGGVNRNAIPTTPLGDGGPAVGADLPHPYGMAIDSAGNFYIADDSYSVVRKVSPSGIISTIAGIVSSASSAGYSGDGGPATKAQLNYPFGLALDAAGNLYIADGFNYRIRKVDPNGIITTIAGTGSVGLGLGQGDGNPATQVAIGIPHAIAVDSAGNLYFTEQLDVRKITPNGIISTIAKPSSTAPLISPYGIAVDGAGNVYFSDHFNNTIRMVTPAGVMTTVAGSGAGSFQGDGGPATAAGFYKPDGIAVDAAGNLFIADTGDNRVRMISNGTITTIAGTGALETTGDGGPATSAGLCNPSGLILGSGGVVYIADQGTGSTPQQVSDGRVRKLSPPGAGAPPAIKSGGVVSASAFGQFTSVAPGSWIEIYGTSLASDSRSWSGSDFTGVNAPTQLAGTTVTIGGQRAFIDYVSPTQVNVQVPSNAPTGSQPVVVNAPGGASSPFNITVNAEQPGLLSPSSFNIGGKPYVGALFSDGATYVLPSGAIPGVPSRPAKPGESITLYGIGFGPVTPNIPAGQIVQQTNSLASSFQVSTGGLTAMVTYDGLAPNAVGLYQFNVVVPSVPAAGAVPLTFTLAGVPGTQTLYLAVTP